MSHVSALSVTPSEMDQTKKWSRYLSITCCSFVPTPPSPYHSGCLHCCVTHLLGGQAQICLREIAGLNVSQMPGGFICLLMLQEHKVYFVERTHDDNKLLGSGISLSEGLTAGGL